jgi:CBS domain-containing protein
MHTGKISEFMRTDLVSLTYDMPISEAVQVLLDNQISGAPVVNEEEAVMGVLSVTDVARYATLPEHQRRQEQPPDYFLHHLEQAASPEELLGFRIEDLSGSVTVEEIMSPVIFNAKPDTPVSAVAHMRIDGHIHRVLVTDKDRVVGLVSSLDLLRIIAEEEKT